MSDLPERIVTVFGANDPREGDRDYQTARTVGRVLAEAGFAIANGGYGGTMEASARGATEAGGQAVGVTCGIWRSQPNAYITHVVETDVLSQRVMKLIELGMCGYVTLPGATGTLVELATVWEMMCKGMLDRRPLVCVGEFWRPLVEMMTRARPACGQCIRLVPTAEQVASAIARDT